MPAVLLLFAFLLPAGLANASGPADSAAWPAPLATTATEPQQQAGERLATRPDAAPGREEVTPTVIDGTARLDGTVVNAVERAQAEQVARQTPRIEQVDNRVGLNAGLPDRLEAATRVVVAKLIALVAALPLLLVAIAVVIVGWVIGRALATRIHFTRLGKRNPYVEALAQRALHWLIMLASMLLALDLLGATTLVGAVLGSAGVVGLALGFAFKDIAENYVAGILLSLRRPFSPGDHLLIEGHEGKVVSLSARSTLLMTLDGNHLALPNALVFKSVVLNYTLNPNRRFDFTVTIDGGESISHSLQLGQEHIGAVKGVLADPPPAGIVGTFTNGVIELRFFGWIDQKLNDLNKTRSEAIRAVKAAFARAGIEAPRTTQYVFNAPAPALEAPQPANGHEDTTANDTSVNREIDEQISADPHRRDDGNILEP